jgi:hypothetical protein
MSAVHVDAGVLPLTHGEDVSSLISDSGITRYRLLAKVWDVYSNDTNPYWHFPEGVYVEQFDSVFNISGHIKADTAYFFNKIELWRLIGHVHVQNLEGWEFDTSELFWNQKEPAYSFNSIYTDSLVRINKNNGEKIVFSQGIKSNKAMTHYILYKNYMETSFDENNSPAKTDSITPQKE